MPGVPTSDPLDNPVWHALAGPQRPFAEQAGDAYRFQPDVTIFAALPDEPTAASWEGLAALVGPGGVATLARTDGLRVPGGWQEAWRLPGVQMIATSVPPGHRDATEKLTTDDVPDMMELVKRTEPGPFEARTIELGTFVGVRHGGRLVAMAGERLRPPGYTELSGVCTDADYRGRGLASTLVRAVVDNITAAGNVAILHTRADNIGAIRLYDQLGFTNRKEFVVLGVRAPD
jgi:ribosomal protein S18 acetylase RimI-like enzyme